jgi:hypothetical protein
MQHEPKKIALFVDFDNIYLGLRETSREAAEAFATRPNSWLRWIEQGMPLDPQADRSGPRESRVLIRRCYLNPDTFGKYRGWFTHSGFTVVDCPSLTSRGKNSSDIVMVMDILDALRHETRFDRFVIMSADADFTPVLQRLRAHDRRTAVLVSGQAAPAYRAACDRLITEDQFIDFALDLPAAPEPARTAAPVPASASASTSTPSLAAPGSVTAVRDPELLAAIGRRVYEEASSSGTLSASELPRILREFKEFTPTSNWLGYYSLQSLAEAVLAHRPELRITNDDPWRIAVQVADEPPAPAAGAPQPASVQQPGAEWPAIRDRVVELVARMVGESAEPVVMGKAAHIAIQEAGPLITETRWLGKGTFKNLLLSAPDLPFRVVASPLPGYLYDPARHPQPGGRTATDGLAELGGEMASLIRRIHQLTDAPKLTPRQYRVLFEVIAKEITRAPYSLMSTGKAVRDQCVERGEPIARQSITLVLRGLSYAGYRFWDPPHRPDNLAYTFRGNLINLLRQAQVTLSDDELRMLDDWLLGPIAEEPHEPAPSDAEAPSAGADPDLPSPAPATVPTMDESPAADPAGAPGATPAAEPVEAIEPDFATADALPAEESHDPGPGESDAVPADWQPADEASAPPAGPSATEPAPASVDDALPAVEASSPAADGAPPTGDAGSQTGDAGAADGQAADPQPGEAPPASAADADPELADAIPAELSDDHGPAGPDVVTAEWEMSDEPPPAAAEPQSADAPGAPATGSPTSEPPPARAKPSDEIVSAEWQPADAAPSTAPTASAEPVQSAAPAEPPASAAPSDEIVAAEWQPADAPVAETEPPAAAAPDAPAANTPAADTGPADIFTPFWEAADEAPAAAPEPVAPSDPADAPAASGAETPAGDAVTAPWEIVGQAEHADGPAASPEAPSEPTAQMDVFPADPPAAGGEQEHGNSAPAQVPAASDAEEAPPQAGQPPLWRQR